MTQTPEVPAGWYPDGSGASRYWDGLAWTEHIHVPEVPEVAVVPQAAPETPVVTEVAVPVAPVAVAPVAAVAADVEEPRDASSLRRVWFAAGAAGIVLVLLVAVFALLSSGGDDAPPGGVVTSVSNPAKQAGPTPGTKVSPVTYGASPAVVASAAACTDPRDAETSEPASPVEYRRITCTLGTATVQVDTFPSAKDQGTAEGDLRAYLGTGRYASGEGWVAIDDSSSAESARVFVSALGGSVKGA